RRTRLRRPRASDRRLAAREPGTGARARDGARSVGPPDRRARPTTSRAPDRHVRRAGSTGSRHRARRGGPATRTGHEGKAGSIPARGPDRDRVLQRRGARPPLRPLDRGARVTEPQKVAPTTRKLAATNGMPIDGAGTKRRRGAKAGAAGSDYTAASIQVLEGLEAVRRR